MINSTIKIEGAIDQADVQRLQTIVKDVWGIRQCDVNMSRSEVVITYDEKAAALRDFERAIIDAGFQLAGKNEVQANDELVAKNELEGNK